MNRLYSQSQSNPAAVTEVSCGDAADRPSGSRRPLRVMLVAPTLDPSSGGIAGVGHSIGRLLATKAGLGGLRYRGFDLHGEPAGVVRPDAAAPSCVRSFGSSRWRFSAAVLRFMSTWANLVIFTHVGQASLMALLPRGFGRVR